MKRNMRGGRLAAVTILSGAALLALAGCSNDTAPAASGGGSTGGADGSETVGFSAGFLDSPFNAGLVRSVTDEATADGLTMLPATDAQSDASKQISDVNSLLSQGVQGLIMFPTDSDAIVPAIEAANEAGVPVVTTDVAANGGEVFMNIRADNVGMGEKVCQEMGELLDGEGTVLEIHGDLSTSSGIDRTTGFNDCMTENYPNIEITSRDAKWKTDQAVDIAQTVLTTGDFDGVFLASDSVMLNGVEQVMRDNNLLFPAGEDGHIALITIDGTAGSLEAVRQGYVDAVISQPVDLYGTYAVYYMKAALAGETFEVGETDHDSEIVEYKGNLADMLPATTVTSENVDDDTLWGNAG